MTNPADRNNSNEYPRENFGNTDPQPAISFGAVFGAIAGGILFINGIATSTSSSIHQIYRVLNVGFGAQLVALASIAQHGKTVRKE